MGIAGEGQADQARALAHGLALGLGGDRERAEAAATVAAELARNVARHGRGREILIRELREGAACALEVHALDRGPGIGRLGPVLSACETGLGAVRRLSEEFKIRSRPEEGTVAWARCRITEAPRPEKSFECAGISVAVAGEELCGDGWDAGEANDSLRVILADGLGHGLLAATASAKAVSIFQRWGGASLPECLTLIHEGLLPTRGAAASMAAISPAEGSVTMAGVGNVTVRLIHSETTKSFMGDHGTLGAGIRRITGIRDCWTDESVLVPHSDGISSRWDPGKYPGLARAHPALIAGVLHRDFRRRHDDSTVVVARQRRRG